MKKLNYLGAVVLSLGLFVFSCNIEEAPSAREGGNDFSENSKSGGYNLNLENLNFQRVYKLSEKEKMMTDILEVIEEDASSENGYDGLFSVTRVSKGSEGKRNSFSSGGSAREDHFVVRLLPSQGSSGLSGMDDDEIIISAPCGDPQSTTCRTRKCVEGALEKILGADRSVTIDFEVNTFSRVITWDYTDC